MLREMLIYISCLLISFLIIIHYVYTRKKYVSPGFPYNVYRYFPVIMAPILGIYAIIKIIILVIQAFS